ncbi:hypothetical protein [Pseudomonas kurunegalensis]|uniref:hypothetical protein n=1 Tax=Pseudomonas kurunegalensis TaxID=485880 RepID=UPI003556984B
MIHSLHNARFLRGDNETGQSVAGYVFALPNGDDYIQTQSIRAIWEDGGQLYVEDAAGARYYIVDFEYDRDARQVGKMLEEIIRGFLS